MLTYSLCSYLLSEDTIQPLQIYQNARIGRSVFKVENSSFLLDHQENHLKNHFLQYENLMNFKSFNGHILKIEEKYTEQDLLLFGKNYEQLNNVHKNNKQVLEYLESMQSEIENVKKRFFETNKEWYLIYVDQEHVQDFISYMDNFPHFKTEQINLNEYLSTTTETVLRI